MVVDAHMHVGTWDHADFLGRSSDVADVIEVMAASGLDGAVLVPTDRVDNQGLLDDARRAVAGGFDGSFWFVPWARAAGQGGEGDLAWIESHMSAVAGIKIHPSLSRLRITEDGFRPALELAEAHERVVLVHCGRWQEIASYRFAVEAAQRHPRARFVLAHAGGDTPPNATAAARMVADTGVTNVWFEFSGVREYWVIERNVALLGAGRYMMGSDYNLAHPLMYIGAVRGMALPEADKRRILGDNAREVFGEPLS